MPNVTEDNNYLLEKEQDLIRFIKNYKRILIAFSGGVDSTYLLSIVREALGDNASAVFARGAMISSEEETETINLVKSMNVPLEIKELDILSLNEFVNNSHERCFYCKTKIFSSFQKIADRLGCEAIFDGTNFSDEGDFRPGMRALKQLGVVSPLKEVGLIKDEIRFLSKLRGLPTWDKPSMACLASRIPYGDKITGNLLKKVEQAEKILRQNGYIECRVRIHDTIARIEIPDHKIELFVSKRKELSAELLKLGFRFITLDLEGLRSGSLNPVERG